MTGSRVSDTPLFRSVRFICTDRGTHPSREIAIVARDEQDGSLSSVGAGQTVGDRVVRRRDVLRGRPGRAFWELPRCPTCGRSPRVGSDAMRSLVYGVLATSDAEHVPFDASYLD